MTLYREAAINRGKFDMCTGTPSSIRRVKAIAYAHTERTLFYSLDQGFFVETCLVSPLTITSTTRAPPPYCVKPFIFFGDVFFENNHCSAQLSTPLSLRTSDIDAILNEVI